MQVVFFSIDDELRLEVPSFNTGLPEPHLSNCYILDP